MRFPSLFLLACIATFFSACTLQTSPLSATDTIQSELSEPKTGAVYGRILDADSNGVALQPVRITSDSAEPYALITDSLGYYQAGSLNPGHYLITAACCSASVFVDNGDSITAPAIVLPADSSQIRAVAARRIELFYTRNGQKFTWARENAPLGIINNAALDADSMQFRGALVEVVADESGPAMLPAQTRAVVTCNADTVFAGFCGKGRFVTPTVQSSGCDTFVVAIDDAVVCRLIVVDSYHSRGAAINHVLVTTAPIELRPVAQEGYGHMPLFSLGRDTFRVQYEQFQQVDFDLFMINDSTGDTCWWRNPHPDWGARKRPDDNPLFEGDEWLSTYHKGELNDRYVSDRITIPDAAEGDYHLYVRFYEGPEDSVRVLPEITIEIGFLPNQNQIIRLYQNRPERPLERGEIWYAGALSFPSGRYTPVNQAIIEKTESLHKSRVHFQ